MYKAILVLFTVYAVGIFGYSQNLPDQHIDTIYLKTSKSFINKSITKWSVDQTLINQYTDLPSLVSNEANVYLKSYGAGGIATLSVRGGSASHSLLMWNDVPLFSPMLGLQDLRLTPLELIDELTFTQKGASTLWGSGAISGAINMNSKASFQNKNKLTLGFNTGSFGLFKQSILTALSSDKLEFRLKWIDRGAQNDYDYHVGQEYKKLSNASYSQNNLISELFYKVSNSDVISFHYWKQTAMTEIPPTTTQNFSQASQNDNSQKYLLKWRSLKNQLSFNSKVAYINDVQNYNDPLQNISSTNEFQTLFLETGLKWEYNDISLFNLALSTIKNTAQSKNYIAEEDELRTAIYPSYQWNQGSFSGNLATRVEWQDQKLNPIMPSMQVNFQTEAFFVEANLSRNYRYPSLNDRYWNPGGNPTLLPESGWSQSLSLQYTSKTKEPIEYSFQAETYNRKISNWILWSITDGNPFFSPNNIAEVWSRGIELKAELDYSTEKWILKNKLNYSLTKSTNQIDISSPEIAAGEQLLYTPVHMWSLSTEWNYKNLNLSLIQQYVGETQGINESIEPYLISNLYAGLDIPKNKEYQNTFIFFKCNNIWNSTYRVIERRPMPGRNIEIGINHTITK